MPRSSAAISLKIALLVGPASVYALAISGTAAAPAAAAAAHALAKAVIGGTALPTAAQVTAAGRALSAPGSHDNPAMVALFEPCAGELASQPCLPDGIVNPLPWDLPAGALLRLGPNPQPGHACPSFLDGDGMVHAITWPPQSSDAKSGSSGSPTYSRAYVRTRGFAAEAAAGGQQRFAGTLVAPRGWPMLGALARNVLGGGVPGLAVKDTCNTALRAHGGKLLALMEQGLPTELAVSRSGAVRTVLGGSNLGGAVPAAPVTGGALSAHSRVDPRTGDLVSVSYDSAAQPFARHDVWSASGELRFSAGVDLPAPVMLHDLAITASHTLVLDLPMTVRPLRALLDRFPVEYEPTHGARIGAAPRPPLLPATATSTLASAGGAATQAAVQAVQWVDVPPCVVLHTCNAFVRADGCTVLTALRCQPAGAQSFICDYTPAFLHEWVLDFDGAALVSERYLSDVPVEFPAVNPAFHGDPTSRWCYCLAPTSSGGPLGWGYGTPASGILIGGLVKLDLSTGALVGRHTLPAGQWCVSEPTFVARQRDNSGQGASTAGAAGAEDDGYVLLVVSSVAPTATPAARSGGASQAARATATEGAARVPSGSELLVFDAANINAGPVARLPLPADLPYGLHSAFVPWSDLENDTQPSLE